MDAELCVRLSDNSLARDLFPGDYNCLGDNENRPVKWMAIEALMHKRFSPASDVVRTVHFFTPLPPSDPPENCHLNVNKLPKILFFPKNYQNVFQNIARNCHFLKKSFFTIC